jgi:hypothetical protein
LNGSAESALNQSEFNYSTNLCKKMNYQITKDKYLFRIKNKQGLYIDLIEDEYKFINVYFPDGVWTHIKKFLFDPAITKLMNTIADLEERKIIFNAEWLRMTYQSQEWNFQKQILWNNCQIIGVYQRKIKHLVKKDRPRHTLIN